MRGSSGGIDVDTGTANVQTSPSVLPVQYKDLGGQTIRWYIHRLEERLFAGQRSLAHAQELAPAHPRCDLWSAGPDF